MGFRCVTLQRGFREMLFEATTNVSGYMSSGYRLLLYVQPQKRQSPGNPSVVYRSYVYTGEALAIEQKLFHVKQLTKERIQFRRVRLRAFSNYYSISL